MNSVRYTDDDLLSLSGIQHFFFCKRQWALIHIEQQWEENLRTTEGRFIHERVDDPFLSESRGNTVISRSVPLVSYRLGFYGIADLVEYTRNSSGISLPGHEGLYSLKPVEYKRGKPKIDERDEVQLCSQAICLEEMFSVSIPVADFFYHETRRRTHLELTEELRCLVFGLAEQMHQCFSLGQTPPAEKGKPCSSCSLVDVCLPNLTRKRRCVQSYVRTEMESIRAGIFE